MSQGFIPRRVTLADAMANPVVPEYGGYNLLWNGTTWDRARAAALVDLDTAVGTEKYVLAVNLRTGTSGGTKEIGAATTDPLIVRFNSAVATLTADGLTAPEGIEVYNLPFIYNATGGTWERARQAQLSYSGSGTTATGVPAAAMLGYYNSDPLNESPASNNFHVARITVARALHVNPRDSVTGVELQESQEVTWLSSAARNSDQTSGDYTNYNGCSKIVVVLDVTSYSAGGLTLYIDGKDSASGKYIALLTAAAPVASVTTFRYVLMPTTVPTAPASTQMVQDILPRVFRLRVVKSTADNITYSVGFCLVK